jgi:hypothetical protein
MNCCASCNTLHDLNHATAVGLHRLCTADCTVARSAGDRLALQGDFSEESKVYRRRLAQVGRSDSDSDSDRSSAVQCDAMLRQRYR